MNSTKKLSIILVLLILSMGVYFFVIYHTEIIDFIVNIKKEFSTKKVIIPSYTKYHRVYMFDTVSETDNFYPKNLEDIKKIYYTVLNNGWDEFSFYCDEDYISCIDDVKTIANSDQNEFILTINNYVNPYNSYKKYNTSITGDEITLQVNKLYTEEEINKINEIIDSYLIDNNITPNNVTIKTIEKIHDYIIENVSYDEEYEKGNEITDSNKATGALINKKALCSGYSDTFALFLDKIAIPNFKVTTEEHEWNAIYFNNKWTHIDVTWDDDEVNKNNNRNFFMISTEELLKKDKKDHDFKSDIFLEIK